MTDNITHDSSTVSHSRPPSVCGFGLATGTSALTGIRCRRGLVFRVTGISWRIHPLPSPKGDAARMS